MDISTAVDGAVSVLRRKPAEILPFYLLGTAVPALTQTILIGGLVLSYAHLAAIGRMERVRAELATVELSPPGPEPDPDATAEWFESLLPLFELLLTPTVVSILSLTALLALLVTLVASAGVAAGQLSACYGRLRNERGSVAGIAGARRFWLAFLGLNVLEFALWVVLTALAVAVVVWAASVSSVLGVLVGLVAFGAWTAGVAGVRALFAFAAAAVVVDDAGVGGALRGSWGFIRAHPARALVYYGIAIGLLVGFGVLLSVATAVRSESVAVLLGAVVLAPALDLLKVGLYAGHRGTVAPQMTPAGGVRSPLVRGLRRGGRELTGFVRSSPGLHVLAAGLLVGGLTTGWLVAEPFVGLVEASIGARLEGHIPPFATAQFFGNNATVAASAIYAGVALAIPTVVLLWFNGVVLGALLRLEVDPIELAAFVLPHGVIELPAIAIAGAAGLRLGGVWWRTWRGRSGRAEFADDLEWAFWIAVGVGGLLFVAALLEGFVSPYYYRLFF